MEFKVRVAGRIAYSGWQNGTACGWSMHPTSSTPEVEDQQWLHEHAAAATAAAAAAAARIAHMLGGGGAPVQFAACCS